MQNQQKASERQSIQAKDQFFFTRILQQALQMTQINSYIDKLHQKVQRAKWKQNLQLQYNYMPLNSIKKKIQSENLNYLSKIDGFYKVSQKQFQNSDLLEQIQKFRVFSQKLEATIAYAKTKIEHQKLNHQILKKESNQKRNRLKALLKQNMELNKVVAQKMGIQNKGDLIRLIRAKSQKKTNILNPAFKITNNIQKLLVSEKKQVNKYKFLFNECYKLLESQIKQMKSNQDIQSGIYLQIMTKKHNPFSHAGRFSLKSNICNTLHQRYGNRIKQSSTKKSDFNQFQMDWESFKQLNWKQIFGIMIIKNVKSQKIEDLIGLK